MNPFAHKREQILQQMEQIKRMAHGSLQAETRPSQRDPSQERGPYFKHQLWEKGRNVTRRIPAEQAASLTQDIQNRKQFEQLAEEFVHTTVAMTAAEAAPDSKKNGTRSRRPSKRKPPATSSSSSRNAPPSNSSSGSN